MIAGVTSSLQASSTTHVIDLPQDEAIEAGDLLVMQFGRAGSATALTHTGWTSIEGSNSSAAYKVLYRIADGTEGETATFTTGFARASAHVVHHFKGWHGTTPPEMALGGGSGQTPDPPELTPSWGEEADTVWIASFRIAGVRTVSDYPDNYDLHQVTADQTGIQVTSCVRVLGAETEDPSTFTHESPDIGATTSTIAIRQGAFGTPPPRRYFRSELIIW